MPNLDKAKKQQELNAAICREVAAHEIVPVCEMYRILKPELAYSTFSARVRNLAARGYFNLARIAGRDFALKLDESETEEAEE